MILCSFVWIGYQLVTDRETDRQRSALQAMRLSCKNELIEVMLKLVNFYSAAALFAMQSAVIPIAIPSVFSDTNNGWDATSPST